MSGATHSSRCASVPDRPAAAPAAAFASFSGMAMTLCARDRRRTHHFVTAWGSAELRADRQLDVVLQRLGNRAAVLRRLGCLLEGGRIHSLDGAAHLERALLDGESASLLGT